MRLRCDRLLRSIRCNTKLAQLNNLPAVGANSRFTLLFGDIDEWFG